MLDAYLVPEGTATTGSGDGPIVEITGISERILLLTLRITQIVEQESLDVSVQGSSDGREWGEKPLIAFPQKFYRGEHPLLLDLEQRPEIKFLRAHWETARWGRGPETPYFEFELRLREVPKEVLALK